MTLQHGRAAAVPTVNPVAVDKRSPKVLAPADADLVLGTGCRKVLVEAAAGTLAPEQVVPALALKHERPLAGVSAGRLELQTERAPGHLRPGTVEYHLVNAAPEAAKVKEALARTGHLDVVGVDGVVVVPGPRLQPCRTMVCPAVELHVEGCRVPDGGVLRAECGYGVVHYVLVANFGHLRGPEVVAEFVSLLGQDATIDRRAS